MRTAATLSAVIAGIVLGASPALRGAVPTGSEFQVNVRATGDQLYPSVAVADNGDFVVVWYGPDDGSGLGIFGRRFDSSGDAVADEFQVNTTTTDDQYYPEVAIGPDGGFVVAWHSVEEGNSPYLDVLARRFSSSGDALAAEFQVNAATVGYQGYPIPAFDASGRFVVAFIGSGVSSGEIFARRFEASGEPIGVEVPVNTHTTGNQSRPRVAANAEGDFVVVWLSGGNQDGDGSGAFGRRFDAAGAALAAEFQINTYTTGNQQFPRIAMKADGGFVVAWQSPQDGGGAGVFARRGAASGALIGQEFQVNTYTTAGQFAAAVAMDEHGDFVVAWDDSSEDGSLNGIFARRFASSGAAASAAFQVNTHTDLYQRSPALDMNAAGDFVVAWHSKNQDGSGWGVFAQRFAAFPDFDVDGDGAALPLTDGLLILRYLFGFRGATLVNGVVGAKCTRCDEESIEPYLAAHL